MLREEGLGNCFYLALSFNGNINEAAFKVYGFIICNAKFSYNISVLVCLFCSFITFKLEYGKLIFYLLYEQQITAIEAEKVPQVPLRVYVYPCRTILLQKFNVQLLQERRIISSICFLHGGDIDCSDLLSCINFHMSQPSIKHTTSFYTEIKKTNILVKHLVCTICNN